MLSLTLVVSIPRNILIFFILPTPYPIVANQLSKTRHFRNPAKFPSPSKYFADYAKRLYESILVSEIQLL